mmetsp:Transcript_93403/g.267295  ORF Transcript_93403/g.267295 Transcript_93403/m.267295 type:complete len:369 (-) Transcript_93403:1328-2434(-)
MARQHQARCKASVEEGVVAEDVPPRDEAARCRGLDLRRQRRDHLEAHVGVDLVLNVARDFLLRLLSVEVHRVLHVVELAVLRPQRLVAGRRDRPLYTLEEHEVGRAVAQVGAVVLDLAAELVALPARAAQVVLHPPQEDLVRVELAELDQPLHNILLRHPPIQLLLPLFGAERHLVLPRHPRLFLLQNALALGLGLVAIFDPRLVPVVDLLPRHVRRLHPRRVHLVLLELVVLVHVVLVCLLAHQPRLLHHYLLLLLALGQLPLPELLLPLLPLLLERVVLRPLVRLVLHQGRFLVRVLLLLPHAPVDLRDLMIAGRLLDLLDQRLDHIDRGVAHHHGRLAYRLNDLEGLGYALALDGELGVGQLFPK